MHQGRNLTAFIKGVFGFELTPCQSSLHRASRKWLLAENADCKRYPAYDVVFLFLCTRELEGFRFGIQTAAITVARGFR